MNDRAPQVDFNTPYDPIQALALERSRLQGIAADIRSAMRDVSQYNAEGARYAEIAAMWAATLMVAEISKIGLSAGDRRARVLFQAQDRLFEQANKVLKLFGMKTMVTKDEVLKSLDPDLRNGARFTDTIQKTRDVLTKVGIKENKEVKLLLDLVIAMTNDTLLIIQTTHTQQQISTNAAAAQARMRASLSRVNRHIQNVDLELSRMIERAARKGRIA